MPTKDWPCPTCNSKNVRWRNRRWYDGPLNFVETMLTGATVIRSDADISAAARAYMDPVVLRDRGIQEQRKEMGRHTAELFWRCRDCRQSSEAFRADLESQ